MVRKTVKIIGLAILILLAGLFISNIYYAHKLKDRFKEESLSSSEIRETIFVKKLGSVFAGKIWPGFDSVNIPLMLYNDSLAFLTGFDLQPEGWEAIESLDNTGPVYKKSVLNPQAFAVQVDSIWVASLGTINQMNRSMFWGLKKEMPAFIGSIFPFFLIQVKEDMHVTGILHEMFHVYEAIQNEQKF